MFEDHCETRVHWFIHKTQLQAFLREILQNSFFFCILLICLHFTKTHLKSQAKAQKSNVRKSQLFFALSTTNKKHKRDFPSPGMEKGETLIQHH